MKKIVYLLFILESFIAISSCSKETTVIEQAQVYCRLSKVSNYQLYYGLEKDSLIYNIGKFNSDLASLSYENRKLVEISLGIYGEEKFFYDGDQLVRIEVTDKYRDSIVVEVKTNEQHQIIELKGQGAADLLSNKLYTTRITYNMEGGVDSVITFDEIDSIYSAVVYSGYDGRKNPFGTLKGWPINILNDNSQYVFYKFPFNSPGGSRTVIHTLTDTLSVIKSLNDTTSFWARTKLDYEYATGDFQVSCIDSASKRIVYACRYEDCPK